MNQGAWTMPPLSYQPAVKLDTDGDKWLNLIETRILALSGAPSIQMRLAAPGTYLFTPEPGERLDSSLLVARDEGGRPVCTVIGVGDERPEDVRLWAQAIKWAIKRLDTTLDVPWQAVIGEHPDHLISPSCVLHSPCNVGGIVLHPSETAFMEIRGRLSPFGGGQVARTFLVRASGNSQGYDASSALQVGARELNLLCSLLSLISGRLWVIRQAPSPDASLDGAAVVFPLTPSGQEHLNGIGPFMEPSVLTIDHKIHEAWTTLQEDAEIARLLMAYHECLHLAQDRHHSYSLLAAVGIIESLGKDGKLPKCPACGLIKGATSRFRDTLMRVMDEPDARRLSKTYEYRSTTAHDAVLHGMEQFAGITTRPRIYSSSPNEEFEHTVRAMQRAAAQLLALELRRAREQRAKAGATNS